MTQMGDTTKTIDYFKKDPKKRTIGSIVEFEASSEYGNIKDWGKIKRIFEHEKKGGIAVEGDQLAKIWGEKTKKMYDVFYKDINRWIVSKIYVE